MNQPSPWLRKSWFLALALWLLTTSPSRADTYAQWAARVFTAQEQADPIISGENANPAGDGMSNLVKFAFDLDPHKSGVSGLPTIGMVNDFNYATGLYEPFLTITYRYPTSYTPENITYIPEITGSCLSYGWMRGENVIGFYDWQAPQNTGDPYLFRYEVISPISQNPAGIFLRVRVSEGHAIPADWLSHYFGSTPVDPDGDADGDGISNWDEFVNGTDPTDYYNGQLPTLYIAGGGNQRAVAGSLLPTPVSVKVDYYGDYNAPLTFTVAGGALLAPDASGTYNPSATINVRATGQINLNGSQSYVGQVYVYLPTTTSTISTITATATSGGQSASVSTTAVASDQNVQAPSGLDVTYNNDNYMVLSFVPSDTTSPVSIEISSDNGATWQLYGVADPGSTSFTVTGLPSDKALLVRAFTGTDASDGGNPNGAQTNASSSPSATSSPTGNSNVTLYSQPRILGEYVEYTGYDWSYVGFQKQASYSVAQWHLTTDEQGKPKGDMTTTGTLDPKKGYATYVTSGTSDPGLGVSVRLIQIQQPTKTDR